LFAAPFGARRSIRPPVAARTPIFSPSALLIFL
jgi:hypothetical protein